MLAINRAQAFHRVAPKRMTVLFGALYGGLYLRDGDQAFRLTGAALTLLGAILVSL